MKKIWLSSLVLIIINILNYADRYALPAVLPKLARSLHINYFQQGLLGTSFLLVFALASLPLAVLGDSIMRKKIIAGSVIIWSILTSLTGFAQNFTELFTIRTFLGIGESGYSSNSLSLLTTYTKEGNKGKLISLFTVGTLVGTALGFALGGYIADRFGWRDVFFIFGIPGLLFGIFAFFIFEPKRQTIQTYELLKEQIHNILQVKTFWIVVLAWICLNFALGGTSYWLSTYIVRMFHMSLTRADLLSAALLITSGGAGTLIGGALSDYFFDINKNSRFYIPTIGSFLGAIFFLLALLSHTLIVFIPLVLIGGAFLGCATSPLYIVISDVVQDSFHTTAYGVSSVLSHLLGDALAPSIIGYVALLVSLHSALLASVPIALLLCGIFCLLGTQTFIGDVQHITK